MNWPILIAGFVGVFLFGLAGVAALLAFMTGIARRDRDE